MSNENNLVFVVVVVFTHNKRYQRLYNLLCLYLEVTRVRMSECLR